MNIEIGNEKLTHIEVQIKIYIHCYAHKTLHILKHDFC